MRIRKRLLFQPESYVRKYLLLIPLLLTVMVAGCDTQSAVATVTARAVGSATAATTLTAFAVTPTPIPVTPAPPTVQPSPTHVMMGLPPDVFARDGSNAKWLDNALMYSVFVRSFRDSNGDGIGDLQGVIDGLDYIQSLGVDTIWLLPVFKSPSYHGYDTIDYYTVNPDYGTNDDLLRLIKEVRKRKMHILLDLVVNHTSDQNPYFKDAFKNPSSLYSEFYTWLAPDHSAYQTFGNVKSMPKLNYDSPKVRQFVTDIVLHWLDPNNDGNLSEGVDGYRCDVATGPPHDFWQALHTAIVNKNPNAILLGELWTDANTISTYLKGDQFNAAFDFPTYGALSGSSPEKNGDGVLNGKNPTTMLDLYLRSGAKLYTPDSYLVRFVNNHDTNRVASMVNGDMARERMAAVWLMTAPGVPIVYYGEEIGMKGTKHFGPYYDEYRREPLDWYASGAGSGMPTWFKPNDANNKPNDGISVEEEDKKPDSLLTLYRTLGQLRDSTPALQHGSYDLPTLTGDQAGFYLLRRWDDNTLYLVVVNFTTKPATLTFDPTFFTVNDQAYDGQSMTRIMDQGVTDSSATSLTLQPAGYAIYKATRTKP